MAVDLTHPERGPSAMTGSELKAIRKRLGLSTVQMGRAAGYVGSDATASNTIRKYESGMRPVPPLLERLVRMFDRYGVPEEYIDGAPGPQKPGPKPQPIEADPEVIRMFADLDVDGKGRLKK